MDKAELGKRLRKSIDTEGYKGKHHILAQELGVGAPTLSGWLNGTTPISIEHLVQIARKVGQSLDYLVFGADSMQAEAQFNHEPMIGYLSKAVDDLQKHHQNSTRMFSHVALALAEQIKSVAEQYAEGYAPSRNCMDVTEAVILESFSLETFVASKDMRYNYKAGKNAYGHFDEVNAQNLRRGRAYTFLTYGTKEEIATDILKHRSLLKQRSGHAANVLDNCCFACTLRFPFVGFAIYRLDIVELQTEHPTLYERVRDVLFINRQTNANNYKEGVYVGITMLPSPDSPVFVLMEADDVPRAWNYFQQVLAEATHF